jgi:hypothetical protein
MVVSKIHDGAIPDAINGLINHLQWNKKPLPRLHWITKTIINADVNLRAAKDAMKKIFHLHSVDVWHSPKSVDK